MLGLLVVVAVAGGLFYQRNSAAKRDAAGAAVQTIRTTSVSGGGVDRTLRLTGTTSAENFVSLIAPQLRGSRSGGGRSGGGGGGGGGGSSSAAIQSNTGNSSTVSGPSSSATGGGESSGGGGVARATNRSSSTRVGGGGGSSRAASAQASAAAGGGSADLGSTASMLPGGGGGGGGGGSDFMLVLQHLVKPGSQVKKGDLIAEFDRQFMLLRLDDYRASVTQQELDMRKLRANLEVTRKAREQNIDAAKGAVEKAKLDLKTTPVRSEIDSERLKLALEEAEAKHKQLLAEIPFSEISEKTQVRNEELDFQRAQLELKRAEANADRMIAKAQINGLTVMQNIFRGSEFAQIQQGDQLAPGQFYMQVVDTRSMVINSTINQVDVDNLKIGAKARVRFDAYPDLELPAHVYSIGAMTKPGGMRGSFLKEVPVKLKLDKLDPRVIPDLSVAVNVVFESDTQAAAVVPLEGVFRDTVPAKPFVFVRSGTGWQRREVELGLASNVQVAVRSGLKPGEVIALNRPPVLMKE